MNASKSLLRFPRDSTLNELVSTCFFLRLLYTFSSTNAISIAPHTVKVDATVIVVLSFAFLLHVGFLDQNPESPQTDVLLPCAIYPF